MKQENSWKAVEARFRKEYAHAAEIFDRLGEKEGASGFMWQLIQELHNWSYNNARRPDPKLNIKYTEIDLDEVKVLGSVDEIAREMGRTVENNVAEEVE